MALLVLDIGGTSVKYAIWENEGLLEKAEMVTPSTWDEMKRQFRNLKVGFTERYEIEGVAISSPGAVNQEKGIIEGSSAVPYIHYFPIFQEWSKVFECPIAVENDANCAALAEVWNGAGKGLQTVLFVVVGSGIGGAVIVDGKIWRGKHLFGGEFGYMLLTDNGTFSELGTAVHMAKRVAKRKNLHESQLSGKQVFELAEQGDPIAQVEVEAFYHYLALGIYNLQYSFDPEKIIIGGGVSSKEDLIPQLNIKLEEIVKKVGIAPFIPEITLCKYKNDANLIGAVRHYQMSYQT
ncbi:ROK family protein [Heyndrickxia sp. FSL W8-0496]|uniref:ROK family protein n=1 Tax=Heyndrickxia sp. FSL W8-0496 TaxID=2954702 RepID=UPI0030F4D874